MAGHRKTALIVDTDEAVLISLQELLEGDGVDTTTTWDTGEALALLRAKHYDVVLVAEHPPEISCEQFLRKLRGRGDRTPTLVLQSAPRHPFETRYLESLDTYAVLPKCNRKAIAEAVRRCTTGFMQLDQRNEA